MRRSLTITAFAGIMLAGLASVSQAVQPTLYEATFEAFTLGNLNGQDSWVADPTTSAQVVNSPLTAPNGTRYVAQPVNSSVERPVTLASPSRVLFRGNYYGTGVDGPLQDPTVGAANPMAAALGFLKIDATHFQVQAFNGTTNLFVGPTDNRTFLNTAWIKIIVSLNYTTKTFDVSIDNQPYLQNVPFSDNTVTSLNGFKSSTQTGSNIDRIGFFNSTNGDWDEDGASDDLELRTIGGDPLDAAIVPTPIPTTPPPTTVPPTTVPPTLTPTLSPTTPVVTTTIPVTTTVPTVTTTVPTVTTTVPTVTTTIPTVTTTIPTVTTTIPTVTTTIPTVTTTIPTVTTTIPTVTTTIPTVTTTIPTVTTTIPTVTTTIPTATTTVPPTGTTPVVTTTVPPTGTTVTPTDTTIVPTTTVPARLSQDEIIQLLLGQSTVSEGGDWNGDGIVDAADLFQAGQPEE